MGKEAIKCAHEGCNETEYLTVLINQWDDEGEDPDNGKSYCSEHVPDAFCAGCGYFCAGIESFEFSPVKGLCEECVAELRDELGEDRHGNPIDDDDEVYDYGLGYEDGGWED